MATHDNAPIAAISSHVKLEGDSPYFKKYNPVANILLELGVTPVGLLGKKDHIADDHFSAYYSFTPSGLIRHETDTIVDSGLDLTGGIAKHTTVSSLNPKATRDAVSSKKTQIEILQGADMDAMPQTFFVDAYDDEAIASALDAINGDMVIVKPEISQAGLNVFLDTKEGIFAKVEEYRSKRKADSGLMLIQAYMPDIKSSFPSELRFMPGEADKVSNIASNEIRVHVIDDRPVLFHGKTSIKGDEANYNASQLVFFDQDYWPPYVYDLSRAAALAFRAHTGDADSRLMFDFTPGGQMMTEINGKNPVSIDIESNLDAGYQTHVIWANSLANKIASMAHREYDLRGNQ